MPYKTTPSPVRGTCPLFWHASTILYFRGLEYRRRGLSSMAQGCMLGFALAWTPLQLP